MTIEDIPIELCKTFDTMEQCSSATKISRTILKTAKAHGCPGFNAHRIDWRQAGPWVHNNYGKIEEWSLNSLEDIKKENLIKDGLLKDLEIQKKKREFLSPEEVKSFLGAMAASQSAVLKKLPKELPPKIVGRPLGEIEQLVEQAVLEVFDIFKEGLKQWNKKS